MRWDHSLLRWIAAGPGGRGDAMAAPSPSRPDRAEALAWLHESDPARLEVLWRWADDVRRARVGDEVHLRGLIEVSNNCHRQCHYCGLRAGIRELSRYRMTADEVAVCARQAVEYGFGTVVLQAGEDEALTADWVEGLIRRIKEETGLAVTLSLGERSSAELAAWRRAGADRYLLRIETSNAELFARIHPSKAGAPSRADRLLLAREMGYEIGSGVMVGLPGQSLEDLANDLDLFARLDLDMIGIGPFIPHPATPLGREALQRSVADRIGDRELMTYKMLALTRLACPEANIPSTTALATINVAAGRELGLQRGANVVMPNLTPPKYRVLYEVYPGKPCTHETADALQGRLDSRIQGIGRRRGSGPGGRRRS